MAATYPGTGNKAPEGASVPRVLAEQQLGPVAPSTLSTSTLDPGYLLTVECPSIPSPLPDGHQPHQGPACVMDLGLGTLHVTLLLTGLKVLPPASIRHLPRQQEVAGPGDLLARSPVHRPGDLRHPHWGQSGPSRSHPGRQPEGHGEGLQCEVGTHTCLPSCSAEKHALQMQAASLGCRLSARHQEPLGCTRTQHTPPASHLTQKGWVGRPETGLGPEASPLSQQGPVKVLDPALPLVGAQVCTGKVWGQLWKTLRWPLAKGSPARETSLFNLGFTFSGMLFLSHCLKILRNPKTKHPREKHHTEANGLAAALTRLGRCAPCRRKLPGQTRCHR